jgi:hypothetical protein
MFICSLKSLVFFGERKQRTWERAFFTRLDKTLTFSQGRTFLLQNSNSRGFR